MKKIKINSVLIVLMFSNFISCQNSKNENENINKIEKIQIKSVDFSIMTIISIECDKFEESFDNYRTVLITDTAIINELFVHIDTLQPIDSTYSTNVNTRAKIDLFSKNDTNTICVGNLTLEMNNDIYRTPRRLIGFIEEQRHEVEGTAINTNLNRFDESVTAYDKMGNILALQRRVSLTASYGLMDNLSIPIQVTD